MADVIKRVDESLERIGMPHLAKPIFYNCSIGIRLEIGDPSQDTGQAAYFEKACKKASDIYKLMHFDVLRIDFFGEKVLDIKNNVKIICDTFGIELPCHVREFRHDEGFVSECYWDLSEIMLNAKYMLMKIIMSDFPKFAGSSVYADAVYFFDTYGDVLFHLYDDRGLDIVAADKESIAHVYNSHKEAVLDYDRAKIEHIFG